MVKTVKIATMVFCLVFCFGKAAWSEQYVDQQILHDATQQSQNDVLQEPAPVAPPAPVSKPVSNEVPKDIVIGLGVLLGVGSGVSKDAIDGYEDTELEQSTIYGGTVFLGKQSNNGTGAGGLEIQVEKYDMVLKENSDEFCTITMIPIVLGLRGQTFPDNYSSGFGFHGGFGLGMSMNKIEKGPFFTNLENSYGAPGAIDMSVENSFIFDMSFGIDYFFTKNLALNTDFKMMLGNISPTITIAGIDATDDMDFDKIDGSHFQALIGLKYWFR